MSSNEISLYRKIDDSYIELAQIKVLPPVLEYLDDEGVYQVIDTPQDVNNLDVISIEDSEWSPDSSELKYKQIITIEKPALLFGKDKVTDEENIIGLAAHIFSKNSKFQKTLQCDKYLRKTDDSISLTFKTIFPKSTLRGNIVIELFFFLKDIVKVNPFQADEIGMRLSVDNIFQTKIIIDGEGASFPITEEENPGGPLWTLRKGWSDPSTDPFDASSVQVALNTRHPLFKPVTKGTQRAQRALMEDIMIQAMAMIIFQTLEDMKEIDDTFKREDALEGSVLAAVNYWISTYDIQDKDIISIMNTLRSNLHTKFEEEGTQE